MQTIRVEYDPWPGYGDREEVQRIDLVGGDDESFASVLAARVAPGSTYIGQVVVQPTDTENWAFAPIDPDVTMAEVSAFAGAERLIISRVGMGGGILQTLGEWAGVGLTLVGLYDLLRRGHDALASVVYRRQRHEAQQWLIAGTDTTPRLELVQCVKTESEWALGDFCAVFDLGIADASNLLRRSGYESLDESQSIWREPA